MKCAPARPQVLGDMSRTVSKVKGFKQGQENEPSLNVLEVGNSGIFVYTFWQTFQYPCAEIIKIMKMQDLPMGLINHHYGLSWITNRGYDSFT